jgi:hypothetical protein
MNLNPHYMLVKVKIESIADSTDSLYFSNALKEIQKKGDLTNIIKDHLLSFNRNDLPTFILLKYQFEKWDKTNPFLNQIKDIYGQILVKNPQTPNQALYAEFEQFNGIERILQFFPSTEIKTFRNVISDLLKINPDRFLQLNSVQKYLPGLTPDQVVGLFEILQIWPNHSVDDLFPNLVDLVKRYQDIQKISFLGFYLSLICPCHLPLIVKGLQKRIVPEKQIEFENDLLSSYKNVLSDSTFRDLNHKYLAIRLKDLKNKELFRLADVICHHHSIFCINEKHELAILANEKRSIHK